MEQTSTTSLPQPASSQKRALSTMSKKRFHEICGLLHQNIGDVEKVNTIIEGIKNIMMFDPNIPNYTPEIGKRDVERKKKIAQEKGMTTYALFVKPYNTKQQTI